MDNQKSLIVIKPKDKIKRFLKQLPWKQIFYIFTYFFIIYASTELLNGNYVAFRKILGLSVPYEERMKYIGIVIEHFFQFPKLICSMFMFFCSYLIVYGITKRNKTSCLIVSTISIIFSVINYVVIKARGIALAISDIYAIQTALNVAKGLKIEINGEFIAGITLFLIANIFLFRFCKVTEKIKTNKMNLSLIFVGILGMLFIFNFKPIMDNVALWSINYAYKNYGAGLTVMKMLKNLNLKEPDNYDKKEIEELLAQYTYIPAENNEKFPNIIVVMNESFTDINNIFNVNISGDNLEYFHQLMGEENIVQGNMHSSKLGGGTSNVEYEFLTQNATAFLPINAIPYQQYISQPVKQSIVTYMNELNYDTYGIHCAVRSNYSRGKVYNFLQFENSAFLEDMENTQTWSNEFTTDKYVYEYWMNIMNEKNSGDKSFTYLLTVQNHSPYVENKEYTKQYVTNNTELNAYLQSTNSSDEALKKLVQYIKDSEKDTILLFFGDHQPNLRLKETYGTNGKYDEQVSSYIVPFFIWANYDIEEKNGIEISANYLQGLLFETANLPMDEYTQYVKEIRKSIPIITTKYYIGNDGKKYMLDDIESPYYEKLQEYWRVIYYQMFDNN